MGLINIGAGLSALGESVANTAGRMGLEEQRSQLETQKLQLAETMKRADQDREFAHQDATTATEIKSREKIAGMSDARDKTTQLNPTEVEAAGLPKGTVAQRKGTGEISIIGSTAKSNEPLTDLGKLKADFDAGRIPEDEYKAGVAKATHQAADDGEPLVEVSDGKGGTIWTKRSQAAGKPGKPEKPDKLTVTDVIAPILQAMADGKELTPSQSKAWDAYTKMDPIKQLIARSLQDAGAAGGLADGDAPPAPGKAPAKAPASKPPKPTQYPDARWSDKENAWIVYQNGKPFALDQK